VLANCLCLVSHDVTATLAELEAERAADNQHGPDTDTDTTLPTHEHKVPHHKLNLVIYAVSKVLLAHPNTLLLVLLLTLAVPVMAAFSAYHLRLIGVGQTTNEAVLGTYRPRPRPAAATQLQPSISRPKRAESSPQRKTLPAQDLFCPRSAGGPEGEEDRWSSKNNENNTAKNHHHQQLDSNNKNSSSSSESSFLLSPARTTTARYGVGAEDEEAAAGGKHGVWEEREAEAVAEPAEPVLDPPRNPFDKGCFSNYCHM
jgi:hypothetical protein